MHKLSIIIPHYNSTNSLIKLLDSIPQKKEIQTIVVDDKSNKNNDALEYIMVNEKYKSILFLENDSKIKGAGKCRNIGLENADGQWVLFADSDDFFLKDFYDIVCKDFSENSDIIFYCPTSIDLRTGNKSNRHIPYEKLIENYIQNSKKENELFLKYKFYVPWSKMISIEFLKKNNIYFDEVIASNDVMFSTKSGYYSDEVKVSKECIYCVVKNSGSLTTKVSEEVFNSRLDTFVRQYKFLKENLTRKDFNTLELSGRHNLINVIKFKFGSKKLISVYFYLKLNNIRLFNFKLMNPLFLLHIIQFKYSQFLEEREYYT